LDSEPHLRVRGFDLLMDLVLQQRAVEGSFFFHVCRKKYVLLQREFSIAVSSGDALQ